MLNVYIVRDSGCRLSVEPEKAEDVGSGIGAAVAAPGSVAVSFEAVHGVAVPPMIVRVTAEPALGAPAPAKTIGFVDVV